jgi:hypothetical protein
MTYVVYLENFAQDDSLFFFGNISQQATCTIVVGIASSLPSSLSRAKSLVVDAKKMGCWAFLEAIRGILGRTTDHDLGSI